MITEKEALELFIKLKSAEVSYKENPSASNKSFLNKIETEAVSKLEYLVKMKSSRYKKFSNYDDLNQDGLEALIKGLKTYKINKGSIFWWLHKYIDTKISRSANQHSTIRFPLRIARDLVPIKEQLTNKILKTQFDSVVTEPDLENRDLMNRVLEGCCNLTTDQKEIMFDHFGFNSEDPKTIKQICTERHLSKKVVELSLKNSLEKIKKILN